MFWWDSGAIPPSIPFQPFSRFQPSARIDVQSRNEEKKQESGRKKAKEQKRNEVVKQQNKEINRNKILGISKHNGNLSPKQTLGIKRASHYRASPKRDLHSAAKLTVI
jgi:hypothetical protein